MLPEYVSICFAAVYRIKTAAKKLLRKIRRQKGLPPMQIFASQKYGVSKQVPASQLPALRTLKTAYRIQINLKDIRGAD